MIELLGIAYSSLFAFCYIPQIIQLIKTGETKGISIATYWMFLLAYAMAILYCLIMLGWWNIPLLNYSSGAFFCSLTIFFYYKYKKI